MELPRSLIRYRVTGQGDHTLVLATDPPVMIEQYDDLIHQLEKYFRVVVFELPGFGYSLPGSGFEFNFNRVNDLVAAFLARLRLGPYLLAFPCVSAYGAVDIATRHSDLVSGVVMIQAPAWAEETRWKHRLDQKGILSKPVIGQTVLQFIKRKSAREWLKVAVGHQNMLPEFIATTDHALTNGACFCLASAFQYYLTDIPSPLSPIHQPALIVWGEADRSHRRSDKTSTGIYCPHAKDIRFENTGHFPELEQPDQFTEAVIDWTRTAFPAHP